MRIDHKEDISKELHEQIEQVALRIKSGVPEVPVADEVQAGFDALLTEIDALDDAGKQHTLEQRMHRQNVITILGNRDTFSLNVKPVGSRVAYLARRLGMRPYPEDAVTGLPIKRGIYASDGNEYYDVIEGINRILDILNVPQ